MLNLLACCLFLISLSVAAGVKTPQVLTHYNFSEKETAEFILKYPELSDLDVAAENVLDIDEKHITLKIYSEMSNDVYVFKKNIEKKTISVSKTFVPFEIDVRKVEGEIERTLFESIQKDTGSEKLATQVTKAFEDEFTSTSGLIVPAFYSIEYTEYFENGRFIKFGYVQSARLIVGRALSEKVLKQDIETLKWSLQPDVSETQKLFYAPVKSSRVSSLFQFKRKHPVKKRIQPHNGIDFTANAGTAAYPAMDGVIIEMGRTRAKGKFILIDHSNGYQTTYDHLRKFHKDLRVGDYVEVHQQIGEVGKTGFATGAHLHFGVLKDNYYVNPIPLLKEYTYGQKDYFEMADLED